MFEYGERGSLKVSVTPAAQSLSLCKADFVCKEELVSKHTAASLYASQKNMAVEVSGLKQNKQKKVILQCKNTKLSCVGKRLMHFMCK